MVCADPSPSSRRVSPKRWGEASEPPSGCDDLRVRAVVQRVLEASVTVDGEVVGQIDAPGLLVYLSLIHI